MAGGSTAPVPRPPCGTSASAINRSTTWVPRSENSKQGGILGSFYKINRLLPHDKFFVAA